MAKNYTENDLLRYLYGELSAQETLEIESQMMLDDHLNKAFIQLQNGISNLEQLAQEPSQTSIDIILSYSQETSSKNLEIV
jgi:anti-sigma factor RsiW